MNIFILVFLLNKWPSELLKSSHGDKIISQDFSE